MDIREATYVCEIAKTKHMTKAADNLFITQPALSKVLKKLETEFDGPLFYRDGKVLLPTELGKIIIKHSNTIINEFSEMYYEIQQATQPEGAQIRLGLSLMSAFLYTPVLSAFCIAHPEIQLLTDELGGNGLFELFAQSKLDIAFAPRPETSDAFNEVRLFTSEIGIGIDSSHPWASKEYITDEDFNNQDYISFMSDARLSTLIKERFLAKNISASEKVLGREMLWLMSCAQSTNTPCIFPIPYLKYNAWNTMVIKPFRPSFPWSMGLLYPKNMKLSEPVRTFIRFVEDYFIDHASSYSCLNGGTEINLSEFISI